MIRCVPVHKDLHPFILSLMQKLISKKIWRWPNLWKGFLRCIEVNDLYACEEEKRNNALGTHDLS